MSGSRLTGDLIEGPLCQSEATAKWDYFEREPQVNPTFPRKSNSFYLIIANFIFTDYHKINVGSKTYFSCYIWLEIKIVLDIIDIQSMPSISLLAMCIESYVLVCMLMWV